MCIKRAILFERSIFVPTYFANSLTVYKLSRSQSYAFEAQSMKAWVEQAFVKLLQEDLCIFFLALLVRAPFDEAAHGRGDAQANKPQL